MGKERRLTLISCDYFKPSEVGEALRLVSQFKERALFAAGCTNILPDIHSGKQKDCVLIDISDLEELTGISKCGNSMRIGSSTTISELLNSSLIRDEAPLLYEAALNFADPVVRNRATVGGNLAYASPAADMAVPLLALDSRVVVQSLDQGLREISLREFFVGPGETVLSPSELILRVEFNLSQNFKVFYVKVGKRNAMAISLASLGLALKIDQTIKDARLALGALAPTPIRACRTEDFLMGKFPEDKVMEEASEILLSEINPISDIRGSREYRVELTRSLFKRAFRAILSEERGLS